MSGIQLQKIKPLGDGLDLNHYEDIEQKVGTAPRPEKHVTYENQGFTSDEPTEPPSTVNVASDHVHAQVECSHGNTDAIEPGPDQGCFSRNVFNIQQAVSGFIRRHHKVIKYTFLALLVAGYAVYFGFAMRRFNSKDEGSVRLLWVTCVIAIFTVIYLIQRICCAEKNISLPNSVEDWLSRNGKRVSWVFVTCLILAVIIYVVVDIARNNRGYNLVSAAGIVIFILLMFITSYSPSRVKWQPVVWGLALQYVLALIILRTVWGRDAFSWLGDRIKEFLDHTDAGSRFVFGEKFTDHQFAFKVLPIVIFFNTVVSILFYLGVMQAITRMISRVMEVTMGTTAGESLNAAGNIFIGQTEAPLMIRPLMPKMTRSELHAVMTGGFATIAGGVMGAFIAMGVPANHLLTASVMSAPAALAMAKLFYPETEVSHTTAEDVQHMEKAKERNIIEAASAGASQSIRLVANIAANLIAFLGILAFINATLTWFGHRVGLMPPDHDNLTFQLICSYLLYPVAFIMGVKPEDCRQVAMLIGIKTFFNEFVAYQSLSTLISNTHQYNCYNMTGLTPPQHIRDDIFLPDANVTLVGGVLLERSIVISTYALCGFANVGSIGIQLGGLGALVPERKKDLSRVVIRAMIAGNVACFMTACIAGLFFSATPDDQYDPCAY